MTNYDDLNFYYDWLIVNAYFTEDELQLVTCMLGYKIETLNMAIYCRFGYRTVDQLMEYGDEL